MTPPPTPPARVSESPRRFLDYAGRAVPPPERQPGPVVFGLVLALVWTTRMLVLTAAAIAVGCIARFIFDS